MKNFISYYRVSTQRQGRSGLSLEAQKNDALMFVNQNNGTLLAEFTEVESRSKNDRTELGKAIAMCLQHNATLVIAKVDRLTSNLSFLEALRNNGVKFICCDMPEASELIIDIFVVMAKHELKRLKERIHKAFEAKRARGETWGGISPNHPKNHLDNMRKARKCVQVDKNVAYVVSKELESGKSLARIATELNKQEFRTFEGKDFTSVQVMRLRDRINLKQVALND